VLPGYGGNPEIVVRNGLAQFEQFSLDLAEMLRRGLIGEQNGPERKQIPDVRQLLLRALCSLCPEVKFAKDHPWHVHDPGFRKPRSERLVAAVVSNYDGRVQQDTTSRAH
jgi:hypothetical protein